MISRFLDSTYKVRVMPDNQFGFMPEGSNTRPIFRVRQIVEKTRAENTRTTRYNSIE